MSQNTFVNNIRNANTTAGSTLSVLNDNGPILVGATNGNVTLTTTGGGTAIYLNGSAWNTSVTSFTPSLTDGTNNATLTVNQSRYLQIGPTTIFWVMITWTSKGSMSGNVRVSVSGLPVAASNASGKIAVSIGMANGVDTTHTGSLTARINGTNTYCELYTTVSGTEVQLTAADLASAGSLCLCGMLY